MSDPSPTPNRVQTTYNLAADHFDAEPLAFWGYAGRRTVAGLGLRPGAVVLDVGCGSGASAIPAAEAVGPGGRVVGIDLAEGLLELARSKAAALGLNNLELLNRDMLDMDFAEGTFDAVISVFSIFFVADMVAALAGLLRLLKPGGEVAVTTWGPDMWAPAAERWKAAVRRERAGLIAEFDPWARITSPEAVEDLLRAAGATNVVAEAHSGSQQLCSPADWWQIVLGSGFRWQVEQLGTEASERVRADNLRWLDQQGIRSIATPMVFAKGNRPK